MKRERVVSYIQATYHQTQARVRHRHLLWRTKYILFSNQSAVKREQIILFRLNIIKRRQVSEIGISNVLFSTLLHEYNGRESQLCTQREVKSPVKRGKSAELTHHYRGELQRLILRKHSTLQHSDLMINSFNRICYRDRPKKSTQLQLPSGKQPMTISGSTRNKKYPNTRIT